MNRLVFALFLIAATLAVTEVFAYKRQLETQKRKEKWKEPHKERRLESQQRIKYFQKRDKKHRERNLDYKQDARNSKYEKYGEEMRELRLQKD